MKKKQSRRKRSAVYEKIKTVLIAVLCLCCVFLIYSIVKLQTTPSNASNFWFTGGAPSEKWSEAAEFTAENALKVYSKLSEPETVIVNGTLKRGIVLPSSSLYQNIPDAVNRAMQSLHAKDAQFSRLADKKEWETALKSNSVYVKYPCQRPTEFDAAFLGIKDSQLAKNLNYYIEALFIPDRTDGGKITVMIPDPENEGSILKIKTSTVSAALSGLLTAENPDIVDCRFAYELYPAGTADTFGGGHSAPAALSPMLPLPTSNISAKAMTVDVPWIYSHGISLTKMTDFTVSLLNVFGYNPNTIRQYSDTNGAMVFVSETGTLRVHKDGLIEYKALDKSGGITLTSENQSGNLSSTYSTAAEITEITERIFSLCNASSYAEDYKMKLTSISKDDTQNGSFRLGMDYFVDGSKVVMPNGSAIEASVSGGVLTELKMWVKAFSLSEDKKELIPVLNAIDDFCAKNSESKIITSAVPVYEYTADGVETDTKWKIEGTR